MSEHLTTRQAAARVRRHLKEAAGLADRGGGILFTHSGGTEYRLALPRGLGFNVRATREGVNVEIRDDGYVDIVTGGDRSRVRDHRGDLDAVVGLVKEYQERIWGRQLGKVEWGGILISATAVPGEVIRVGQEPPPSPLPEEVRP
jgi:hypothetical protein